MLSFLTRRKCNSVLRKNSLVDLGFVNGQTLIRIVSSGAKKTVDLGQ